MGLRSMKESWQSTMAGLTARVMAVSILIGKVYTRTIQREDPLREERRQNGGQDRNRIFGRRV